MDSRPRWYAAADAWFKALGAVALAYLILAQAVSLLRDFADVAIIAIGGIFVAYFVFPIISRLNRRLPLWAALSIVYVGIAAIVLIGVYLLLPTAIAQLQDLARNFPTIQRRLWNLVFTSQDPFFSRLPPPLQEYVQKLPTQFAQQLEHNAADLTARIVNALLLLVTVSAIAIAIPVVSIYMLGESTMAKRFFVQAFPPSRREGVVSFLGECDAVIGGFVRGQVIVAAVIGALAIVALLVLRVPYAFVIGAWAGIADIVPYVGPFAGAIPAIIIAWAFNGPGSVVSVVVAFTLINQLEGHLLGPRIVSSTVKITPLTVIFALLIGAHVFGFAGLVIAVPIAGLIRVALVHLFPDREVTNAELQPSLTSVPQTEVDPAATEC